MVKNMITVLQQVNKHLGEHVSLSLFSPIWGNNFFPPGKSDAGFKFWADNGIQKIGDLFNPVTKYLKSFEELTADYNIPRNQFFKFLQLRNFIRSQQGQSLSIPPLSKVEKIMCTDNLGRGIISKFYNLLVAESSESSVKRLEAWREDLHDNITIVDWERACTKAQSQTINTRLKLLQYNWLMRTYITPEKINKYNSDVPDICIKCEKEKGTLFHCLWQCEEVNKFWEAVRRCIQDIIPIQIPLDAKLFLLGLYPEKYNIRKGHRIFLEIGILLAKRIIALSWKKVGMPSLNKWITELSTTLPLEKITYIIKGKESLFNNTWGPFISFLERRDIAHMIEEPGDE